MSSEDPHASPDTVLETELGGNVKSTLAMLGATGVLAIATALGGAAAATAAPAPLHPLPASALTGMNTGASLSPATSIPEAGQAHRSPTLAETGVDGTVFGIYGAGAFLALLVGSAAVVAERRRRDV